jgi:predicted nucleic acid-binding protein
MSSPRALVVDASVAVKWYVPEVGSTEAAALLEQGNQLSAPSLLAAEMGNILWKKVRRNELAVDDARTIIATFSTACPLTLQPDLRYLPVALDIAAAYDRTVYDSLYLALAAASGGQMITADERLVNALTGTELEPIVTLLRHQFS